MQFAEVIVPPVDIQTRAAGRLLWQFRRSPVLLSILCAVCAEIQEFINACIAVQQMRMPANARGVNLDATGRIVGQDRTLIDYSEIIWLKADTANQGVDQAPAWVDGGPLYNSAQANDDLYRILIQAKVYKNFTKYGSLPEIQEAALEAFGINVSFQRAGGPMEATLLVPSTIPLYVLGFLTQETTDAHADSQYLPPYPAGMRIKNTMLLFAPPLQADIAGRGADQGKASVAFTF